MAYKSEWTYLAAAKALLRSNLSWNGAVPKVVIGDIALDIDGRLRFAKPPCVFIKDAGRDKNDGGGPNSQCRNESHVSISVTVIDQSMDNDREDIIKSVLDKSAEVAGIMHGLTGTTEMLGIQWEPCSWPGWVTTDGEQKSDYEIKTFTVTYRIDDYT